MPIGVNFYYYYALHLEQSALLATTILCGSSQFGTNCGGLNLIDAWNGVLYVLQLAERTLIL